MVLGFGAFYLSFRRGVLNVAFVSCESSRQVVAVFIINEVLIFSEVGRHIPLFFIGLTLMPLGLFCSSR